jgi:hypothetical protein
MPFASSASSREHCSHENALPADKSKIDNNIDRIILLRIAGSGRFDARIAPGRGAILQQYSDNSASFANTRQRPFNGRAQNRYYVSLPG